MRRLVGGSLRVISDDETQFEKYQSIFWHTTSPSSCVRESAVRASEVLQAWAYLAGDDVEMNLHCFAVAVRQHEGGADSTRAGCAKYEGRCGALIMRGLWMPLLA
jgi:hypothetical protein